MPNVEDEAFTSIPDTLHTLVNGDGTDPVVWIRSDQHFFWPQSRIRNIKIARTRKKFLYTLQTLSGFDPEQCYFCLSDPVFKIPGEKISILDALQTLVNSEGTHSVSWIRIRLDPHFFWPWSRIRSDIP